MENCKETFLDDVVAVWPLAEGLLNHSLPETVVSDTISVGDIGFESLSGLRSMLAGVYCLAEDMTGKEGAVLSEPATIKITTDRGVSGYSYTVSLDVVTQYYHTLEKSILRSMEWTGHDYIVERMSGDLYLVRYFAPAQKVTHQTEGAGARVTSTTRNVSGVQLITE